MSEEKREIDKLFLLLTQQYSVNTAMEICRLVEEEIEKPIVDKKFTLLNENQLSLRKTFAK